MAKNEEPKKVSVVEIKPKDLSKYTLIEGFPGMGLIGTISAKYLSERLKAEVYGYIDSEAFIPVVRIHKGKPVNPSRIFIDDKNKIVILISEQIIPRHFTSRFAHAVVDWIKAKKINKVISLSGIHADPVAGKNNMIYGIATNSKSKKLLEKNGIEVIEDGITTGVTAMMLLYMRNLELNAYSIMGNVQLAADYQAAAELIKKLSEILSLKIDVSPLYDEAKKTEQELITQLQQMRKTKDRATEKYESSTTQMTT